MPERIDLLSEGALDHDLVVVIEAGGRDSQRIARAVRAFGVYCEIWPVSTDPGTFREKNVRSVIIVQGGEDRGLSILTDMLTDIGTPFVEISPEEIPLFGDGVSEATVDERFLNELLVEKWGLRRTWTMARFVEFAVQNIQRVVGDGKVIAGLSGGVDSAVAAALVHRAIGSQLHCIFVDHGLLRKGESEQVSETFTDIFGNAFTVVDASDRFLDRLEGVADPEQKRKIIGRQFIRVFEEEAEKLGHIDYLLQGTLYPDVIESGVGGDIVKSHHNVGGLPEHMDLQLLEPLRFLFKDEVRLLGKELGLSDRVLQRQPFPGPGLAVRVIGAIDRDLIRVEREADAIVVEEIEKAGLTDEVWQYFAVVTESQSVGVGDTGRTYGRVAAVRAVVASDGMEASAARLPYEVLERIASRMMTEVPEITRVVYDISAKPPSTIEWE